MILFIIIIFIIIINALKVYTNFKKNYLKENNGHNKQNKSVTNIPLFS